MLLLIQISQVIAYILKKFFSRKLSVVNFRRRFGYTLIELVVVLGVLSLTVAALTMFLTSIFKGTNKANATFEVKQNGQAILDSLERQIRGSISVSQDADEANHLILTRNFGEPLHIRCEGASGVGPNTKNSRITIQVARTPTVGGWRSVSNDDLRDGISIEDCVLEVYTASVSQSGTAAPAVVSISFVAKKTSGGVHSSAEAQFKTTISLRQY